MSIDIDNETLIHFMAAAREFPGKPICIQTLHRWRLRGVRGTKLESCIIGGLRWTSREAIARFIAAQNASEAPASKGLTPTQRKRQSDKAAWELEAMGV